MKYAFKILGSCYDNNCCLEVLLQKGLLLFLAVVTAIIKQPQQYFTNGLAPREKN
jgi:hypothetical protein